MVPLFNPIKDACYIVVGSKFERVVTPTRPRTYHLNKPTGNGMATANLGLSLAFGTYMA
jgi:hypothetical protein